MRRVSLDAYLQATDESDRARLAHIHRAWQIYRGDQPKPLRVLPGEPDDNVRLNLAGLVVDTGVDALFGQDIRVEVMAGDAMDDTATTYVHDVLDANREMLLFQSAATNGAVAGHAAVRIVPAPKGSPVGTAPRLLVVDPEMLRVVWSPDDVGTVMAYVLQWAAIDERGREYGRRQIIARDGQAWMITEQESNDTNSARWTTMAETPWQYGWAPIVDTQNLPEPNAYFGRPDLTTDVLETQSALNSVMSQAARVQRIHGHPKVVATGVGDGSLDVGPDEAIVLPDSESSISLLESRATVAGHIELFRTVKAALHEISRVPEITAGRLDNVGNLSGLALKILYGPLIRKTETKRRLYGAMVQQIAANVCELGGLGQVGDVEIRWPEIVPEDPGAQAATAEALQRAGVSVDTSLAEIGYDPAQEADRRTADTTNIGAALLTAFDRGSGPAAA